MPEPSTLQQAIESAQRALPAVPEKYGQELGLLIRDLEEAKPTLFVRTAEARPMLERCANAAQALAAAVERPEWDGAADNAFADFERAVSKLRNTILVRTQRAT